MGRYRVSRVVPTDPVETFDAWVDPIRAPQWQEQLLEVIDVAPDVTTPGATYRLNYGPGMKRQVTVLTSRRGEIYRVRGSGLGWKDENTVTFAPEGRGTLVTYEVHLDMGLGPIGRFFERRMGTTGAEKKMNQEIERFVTMIGRPVPVVEPGAFLSVDCGRRYRIVQVLGSDVVVVHLRLLSGVVITRPEQVSDVQPKTKAPDPMLLQPLTLPVSSIGDVVTLGQPLFGLDGGFGVSHLAVTRQAFADGLPQSLGYQEPIPDGLFGEIEAWRTSNGPLGGRDLAFGVTSLVSYANEASFGVAKVLKTEGLTVHLRLYSDIWDERPTTVNPWTLKLDPIWAENPGLGHIAVSSMLFGSIQPKLVRLAMVGDSEMEGYRLWKEQGGGKLGVREVWRSAESKDEETTDE